MTVNRNSKAAQLKPPVGWPLLPLVVEGGLQYPTLEDSIRQTIKVILLTRPGEQLMRPEFGAGLNRFLHEPNTLVTRRRIRDAVQTSLQRWEPRILLQRVDVWENEQRADSLRVEIVYQVRRTALVETMSLTMNLES